MTSRLRRLATWLGELGGIARGIVFAAVGVFMLAAGAQHRPGKAKGIDSTLRTFAHTPLGPWLLVTGSDRADLVRGVLAFEARYRRV